MHTHLGSKGSGFLAGLCRLVIEKAWRFLCAFGPNHGNISEFSSSYSDGVQNSGVRKSVNTDRFSKKPESTVYM